MIAGLVVQDGLARLHVMRCVTFSASCLHQPFKMAVIGAQAPTFACLFTPAHTCVTWRRWKRPLKSFEGDVDELQECVHFRCCKRICLEDCTRDFLCNVMRWREAWSKSLRSEKQTAILEMYKGRARAERAALHPKTVEVTTKKNLCWLKCNCFNLDGSTQVHHFSACEVELHPGRRPVRGFPFLGKTFCKRAFRRLTGINPWRLLKSSGEGGIRCNVLPRRVRSTRDDEMKCALWAMIQKLHSASPFFKAAKENAASMGSLGLLGSALDTVWRLPFHHKKCLWILVLNEHVNAKADRNKVSHFIQTPSYPSFRRVINLPEFRN
eukprot:2592786-Amphidinium_carterae.1